MTVTSKLALSSSCVSLWFPLHRLWTCQLAWAALPSRWQYYIIQVGKHGILRCHMWFLDVNKFKPNKMTCIQKDLYLPKWIYNNNDLVKIITGVIWINFCFYYYYFKIFNIHESIRLCYSTLCHLCICFNSDIAFQSNYCRIGNWWTDTRSRDGHEGEDVSLFLGDAGQLVVLVVSCSAPPDVTCSHFALREWILTPDGPITCFSVCLSRRTQLPGASTTPACPTGFDTLNQDEQPLPPPHPAFLGLKSISQLAFLQ